MTERTETQQKIVELTEAMRDLLLYKNESHYYRVQFHRCTHTSCRFHTEILYRSNLD